MYEYRDDGIFHSTHNEDAQLTNFTAKITTETTIHNGNSDHTILTLIGEIDKKPLPAIDIPAAEFAAMAWVPERWGMKPIIFPAPAAERHLRTAIQMNSEPEKVDIYACTGWHEIAGKPAYLHGGGRITEKGPKNDVKVTLPTDLRRYALQPDPDIDKKAAFRASISLLNLAPHHLIWPLIAATYRAAIGPADFALHIAGRTGTFKSELVSLAQSHYGPQMDARHLPASWSSTANALERLAFHAQNATFTIDDYVPTGTAWQVRALSKTADQLFRAQGNQAGRARMTDTTAMQATFYPRGLIISTGEDIPEGHSIRARLMIIEMSPGDVSKERLTVAQTRRMLYQQSMIDWLTYLASDLDEIRTRIANKKQEYRDAHIDVGHPRIPPILGDLLATTDELLQYGQAKEYITAAEASSLSAKAHKALTEQAAKQFDYMNESDPAEAAIETIRHILAAGFGHLRLRNGGIPNQPALTGWQTTNSQNGDTEHQSYRANGPLMGWADYDADELLLDLNAFALLKRHAGGKLAMTKPTLLKRLADGGKLKRTDPARQRLSVRVTCQGHVRNVLAFPLTDTLNQADS